MKGPKGFGTNCALKPLGPNTELLLWIDLAEHEAELPTLQEDQPSSTTNSKILLNLKILSSVHNT